MAAPVLAGCPQFGIYSTAAGDLTVGRASESWPTGSSGQIGNTVLAQSWDGGLLAQQWRLDCTAICTAPELIQDTVDADGNGQHVYNTQYCGGLIWLSGVGTVWSNGDLDYTADVLTAIFTTTIDIAAGVPVARNTVILVEADVLDCTGVCLVLEISLATELGQGEGSTFPPDYPLPALQADCIQDPLLLGSWWDVSEISMVIEGCTVATEGSNWSRVKSMYR